MPFCTAYGGVVQREAVRAGADWFVEDFGELTAALKQHSIAFIGSGELVPAALLARPVRRPWWPITA